MENTGERLLTEIYDQNTLEHLHRYAFALQFVKNKKVVDIASGEGYGSNLLASEAREVIGIDIDNEAVKHAKLKYIKNNLTYLQGSADNIPIASNSIDIVTSFETIEHHDKHEEMMNEIKRILTPMGILIISSPDKQHYSVIPNFSNKYHIKELFLEEFQDLIKKNFNYHMFLNQKINFSSLIIQNICSNFYEFTGDFEKIEKHNGILKPIYNIAIASQNKIENVFSSSFDGEMLWLKILEEKRIESQIIINRLLKSKSYKLGKFILTPFSRLKNIFNG